ncbi:MAG: AmmeMemoRadiSam system radical SAM enzyme [Mariniphaga sp.]
METSLFYKTFDDGNVKCQLCPHGCLIGNNEHGFCNTKINHDGHLYSETFGKITAISLDPIEKKPLYHFYPGTKILSIGSFGCTLKCSFCQNYGISQVLPGNLNQYANYNPETVVRLALGKPGNIGIAFTYNEPTTFYEFMLKTSNNAVIQGLKTVMVTNGYINPKPLEMLLPFVDAFNVDLKAFSDSFYRSVTQSKLGSVKKAIKQIADSKKHLEITNLVIPGLNDNVYEFEEMVRWIAGETGDRTVLHLSRYFPNYQMEISPTPIHELHELYEIAKKHLKYVYLGNVIDTERNTTYCDECGNKLIVRELANTDILGLDQQGKCRKCGNHILKNSDLKTI